MKTNPNTPVISIVLGSFNRYRLLKETVKSIRNNGIEVPYEIIIVDGGSRDGSAEWLIKQPDILTIIQHNRIITKKGSTMKHSWGYFMNLAFKSAKGKYILMISDDCLLHPGAVMNGYRYFEDKIAEGRKIGALAFYWRNFPYEKGYHVSFTLGKLYVNHGMYLREVLEKIDFINEDDYKFYAADCDLCLKIWHSGYEVIEAPDSYVEHMSHANKKLKGNNMSISISNNDQKNLIKTWENIFDFNDSTFHFDKMRNYCDKSKSWKKFCAILPVFMIKYCAYRLKLKLFR